MSASNPDILMMEITRLRDDLNKRSFSLSENKHSFFRSHSLPTPKFTPPELGFLLAVSWLYVLYYEAGKINIDFILGRFPIYKIDIDGKVAEHVYTVGRIRTYLHHNLDPDMKRDSMTQEVCQKWMKKQCNTSVPESEQEWFACLLAILEEAIACLKSLKECVREIERDENPESIILSWNALRERYHPAEQFDELITLVASDLGYEYAPEDSARLRKRFYNKWIRELNKMPVGYDFSIEARKLIEFTLLYELTHVLPITSLDIIKELHIEPGPIIEELLREARKLYDIEHLSRLALLERLQQYYTTIHPHRQPMLAIKPQKTNQLLNTPRS